jgi:VWFA-related protein
VSFAERVDWLQDCTSDPNALTSAFHLLKPGLAKKARMLDAVHDSVARLRTRSNVRRVLLLISESRDRGSETPLDSIALETQNAGVTVYAATYSAFKTGFTAEPNDYEPGPIPTGPPPPEGRERVPISPPAQRVDLLGAFGEFARLGKTKTTEVLANGTGGTEFAFTRQRGLEDAIEKLGDELNTQYVLSFPPDSAVPGYHRLEVRVNRPGEYRVRARPGYWSIGSAQSSAAKP